MQISQFQLDPLTEKVTVVLSLPDGQGSISLYSPKGVSKGDTKAVIKATALAQLQAAADLITSL